MRSAAATRGTAAKRISVDATGEAAFTTTGRRFRIEGLELVEKMFLLSSKNFSPQFVTSDVKKRS